MTTIAINDKHLQRYETRCKALWIDRTRTPKLTIRNASGNRLEVWFEIDTRTGSYRERIVSLAKKMHLRVNEIVKHLRGVLDGIKQALVAFREACPDPRTSIYTSIPVHLLSPKQVNPVHKYADIEVLKSLSAKARQTAAQFVAAPDQRERSVSLSNAGKRQGHRP